MTVGSLGEAESDAARLIARIRGAWEERRRVGLRIEGDPVVPDGHWVGPVASPLSGNPTWRRAALVPPSGPFARLAGRRNSLRDHR